MDTEATNRYKLFFIQLKEIFKNLGESFRAVGTGFKESDKKMQEIMGEIEKISA